MQLELTDDANAFGDNTVQYLDTYVSNDHKVLTYNSDGTWQDTRSALAQVAQHHH